jgi:hypothetical protein
MARIDGPDRRPVGLPGALSPAWLAYLHEAVDELDELEPPFAR